MANLNSSIVNGFLRVTGKLKVNSLEVESSEVISNLNADLLDGKQGSDYASSTDVESLTTQVNTNTGNILTNLEKIQEHTEQIGTNKNDISTLTSRMNAAEDNIDKNTEDIGTLNTNTNIISGNLSNLSGRVGTNEGDIASLKTKTDTTNTNLANLTSQVNTNATNIQTNANDVDALETKTDTMTATIEDNTEKLESILQGTAEIPTVANAEVANNANKLGGQLPAFYAKATDLNNYLKLVGGTVTGQVTFLGQDADKLGIRTNGINGIDKDGVASPLYINNDSAQPVYVGKDAYLVYHSGNIPQASTSVKGIVKLINSYESSDTTLAPTANALKAAYDKLNSTLTTHSGNTQIHLTDADRVILSKANKFKGYFETETALKNAHPTGETGDYAIVNTTDTVWIWDADKEGGAGWKDGAGKGSVVSVNNMTGEVVLTKSNIGLGNVDNTSDANKPVSTAQQAALDTKVNKAGDTMTGKLTLSTEGLYSYQSSGGYFDGYMNLRPKDTSSTSATWYMYNISSNPILNINWSSGNMTKSLGDNQFGGRVVSNSTADSSSGSSGAIRTDGGIGAKKAICSDTTIVAGTSLKTKSGIVNFNDKVNVKYNATEECIEYIFS